MSLSTAAYDALAGSCDCHGDDPCEDCREAVEWFERGARWLLKEAKSRSQAQHFGMEYNREIIPIWELEVICK